MNEQENIDLKREFANADLESDLKKPEVFGYQMAISGVFPRVARLDAEYHEHLEHPIEFIAALQDERLEADVFSFVPPVYDRSTRYDYLSQPNPVAVLDVEDYDTWWRKQLNDKTRNMVRKSAKKGVVIQLAELDDEFVKGIQAIYNESPIVQGRPSRHYGKDLETLRRGHATFPDRSVLISASYEGQLIGFIKMIVGEKSASIMGFMSLVAHRDKAPANGLIAKAVETCLDRGIHCIHYGVWSRRGLGQFKKHSGFQRIELRRYFVPLNRRGRISLSLGLHRSPKEFIPEPWLDRLANMRARWYYRKHRI